jgi:phage-related minor tail protein
MRHTAIIGLALALAACNKAPANEQAVVEGAQNADAAIVDDADDRADHLDEAGAALMADANQVGGAEGRTLRNEAEADLDNAAAVRADGQENGATAEEAIEAKAGLLNGH